MVFKPTQLLFTILPLLALSSGCELSFDRNIDHASNDVLILRGKGPCQSKSRIPEVAEVKISARPGAQLTFSVEPNQSVCSVTWLLNGTALTGTASMVNILSSDLTMATNTLEAVLSGPAGGSKQTWTVIKNTPPECAAQSVFPAPSGSMNFSDTKTFGILVSDADHDIVSSFAWTFNGQNSPTLFPAGSIVSSANLSQATFHPTVAEVGISRSVGVEFSDGYDTGNCQWLIDVVDPSYSVNITGCSPGPSTQDPTAPPADDDAISLKSTDIARTFVVSATGASLHYQWRLNGIDISSANGASYSLPYADLPSAASGFSNVDVEVSDPYGNKKYCAFKVKRNAPPVINAITPVLTERLRMNSANSLALGVTATDPNGDSLTYTWTVDSSQQPTYLPTGAATATLEPKQQSFLLGDHTIAVTVTDTSGELTTQSWNVNINEFSDACNNLGPGQLCTLVGSPGAGDGLKPTDDQQKIKINPAYIADDGAGNIFFSDSYNHVVWFLNRGTSAITRLQKTVQPGQLLAIVGNGVQGKNAEGLKYTATKLNDPSGIVFANDTLYIADKGNHRVVKIAADGTLTTVLGTTNTSQNATTNTEGSTQGKTQVCGNPTGLWLYNDALYVTCHASASIKRLNLTSGEVSIIVGKLTSGIATQTSTDGSLGPTGSGQTLYPNALTGDFNTGNLYFTETGSGTSTSYRLRMVNFGGPVTYFDDGTTQTTLTGTDTSGSALPVLAPSPITYSGAPGAPTQLEIIAPSKLGTNNCIPILIVVTDAAGSPTAASSSIDFDVSSTGLGKFYSASSCTFEVTSGSISTQTSQTIFYFKPTANTLGSELRVTAKTGIPTVTVALPYTSAAPANTATRISMLSPSTMTDRACVPVYLFATDDSGNPTTITSREVTLSASAVVTFYSNPDCGTILPTSVGGSPLPYVSLGSSTALAFFKRAVPVAVPASSVTTLIGGASVGTTEGVSSAVKLNNVLGLSPWIHEGLVKGLFYTEQTAVSQVRLLNFLSNPSEFGGQRIGPFEAIRILGKSAYSGYNGDGVGKTVLLNKPIGTVQIGNALVVADTQNGRIRSLDLSVAAGQTSLIAGANRLREAASSDVPSPSPKIRMNSPGYLHFSSPESTLYYPDTGNYRIKAVNVKTGVVSTIIGAGYGDGSSDNQDALTVLMKAPRAITNYGNALVYADSSNGSTGNCLVRAYNPTSSLISLFGNVGVSPGTVSTIAGNLIDNCSSWNLASNPDIDGGAALDNHISNPETIVTAGSDLLVSTGEFCVLKITETGRMYKYIGECGSSGIVEGLLTPSVRIYNVKGMAKDPRNPENVFIVDVHWDNIGKIKYLNRSTSPVTISGVSVPQAGAGTWAGEDRVPHLKTVYSLPISGTVPTGPYWNGIAVYDKWVCVAGGQESTISEKGTHNILCYDRDSAGVIRRFGPDETTTISRSGTPLGTEQEGIAAEAARFYAPWGLAFDDEGNLYFSEKGTHTIRMIRKW